MTFRCGECTIDLADAERYENHVLVVHGRTWLAGRIRRERAAKQKQQQQPKRHTGKTEKTKR